ncbi:MAG TPA: energy-coupling factor ABC transporter permease, partial [Gemmataceae bacterium]|nr:energy-coupling factor ABC transporter permease [Gemmataceae bacterium]
MLALWAVHISDNVLTTGWCLGGLVLAGLLAAVGALRLRDEEIPRIALLAAAFFLASSFHVRVGPSSAHLLLNGLLGVVLGWRACLAIPIGLLLQYLLVGHGGYWVLGVNSCVMVLPALLAYYLFGLLHRLPWSRRPWFRSLLVAVCALAWTLSLVYSVTLLCTNSLNQATLLDQTAAVALTFHPLLLAGAALLAGVAVYLERRLENAPEFALGLLVGELTVLATVALNLLALLVGGETVWRTPALILVVVHLPIAV